MIKISILNIKVTKDNCFEDKENKNESSMNSKIEDKDDKYCFSVDENFKKLPSISTEESEKTQTK